MYTETLHTVLTLYKYDVLQRNIMYYTSLSRIFCMIRLKTVCTQSFRLNVTVTALNYANLISELHAHVMLLVLL